MTRILVTGGNGRLGRELVPRLQKAGYTVRVMSRQARPATLDPALEWVTADIAIPSGLAEALADVEVVINAASNPRHNTQAVDVAGTGYLVQAAEAAHIQHFIHVSIVGIDQVPYPYYAAKVGAEAKVRAGNIPYSILRATQFHTLLDHWILAPYRKWPLVLMPTDLRFQPIETGEVADRLVALIPQPAAGLLPDMGGPEVLTVGQLAKTWFAAQDKHPWILPLYMPGGFANAVRHGRNTCPDHKDGQLTWAEWLRQKYGKGQAAKVAVGQAY